MATVTKTHAMDLGFEVDDRIFAERVASVTSSELQVKVGMKYLYHRDTNYTYGFDLASDRRPSGARVDQVRAFMAGAIAMHKALC